MKICEEKIVVTFDTTVAAMNAEKIYKKMHINGRIIPIPRSISSGCGLAWLSPLSEEDIIRSQKNVHYAEIVRIVI